MNDPMISYLEKLFLWKMRGKYLAPKTARWNGVVLLLT